MEIVRKVTGHRTTEVVTKHYWRPEREQIRQAFAEKMPGLLTDGIASREDKLTHLLESMNAENWDTNRREALTLLKGDKDAFQLLENT